MPSAARWCMGLACPEGLEPPTCCLEGSCSIRLSYGQMGAGLLIQKRPTEWAFLFFDEWSERRDSNSRPSAPKADALPGCATLRLSGELYPLADHLPDGRWIFVQCFLYCVCPNSTSRALSSVSGWRASARTVTPRTTAGRAAAPSNQPFSPGAGE